MAVKSLGINIKPGEFEERMTLFVSDETATTANILGERTRNETEYNVRVALGRALYGVGGEDMNEGRITNHAKLKFFIYTKPNVKNGDYFVWDSVKYNIQDVRFVGKRRYLECSVKREDG